MPFVDNAEIVVRQLDNKNWEVRQPLTYRGAEEEFVVPVGTRTDFASVPRIFVWFLPRYGAYTMAAILHDYLWRSRAANGSMDWVDADGIFRRAMRELRVPFMRRWIMWSAVRWAALLKPRGRRGWLREGWRVLLFSVIAIPFVLPAGLLIAGALVLFAASELAVWVPLRIAAAVKEKLFHQAAVKRVNLPAVEWRTSE